MRVATDHSCLQKQVTWTSYQRYRYLTRGFTN